MKKFDLVLKLFGAVFLLLIVITLFNRATSQGVNLHLPKSEKIQWELRPQKLIGWALLAGAGYCHGLTDAYHADNHVFEKQWGVSEYSFWGSKAWERNYETNRYHKPEGGVNKHKPQLGNTFRDVWHAGNAAQKVLLIGGTFTIGTTKNQKLKHKLLDAGIGMLAYSLSAQQAYNIRYK